MLYALLTVLALLGNPSSAVANGYDVYACQASIAGGANHSFAPVADPGSTAYTSCPAGEGLVARNGWDGANSGLDQGAYMIFDAPSGTQVETISFEAGWQRHRCEWGLHVVASGFDLGGRLVWGYPSNQFCDHQQFPGGFFEYRFTHQIDAPRVRIESRCGAGWCARDGVAAIRIKNVHVRVRDDTPAALAAGRGALWTSNGWLSGQQAVGFDAADGAGVRDVYVRVDGREIAHRVNACDHTLRAPCSGMSLDESFLTAGFGGDGEHSLTLEAVDVAGNPSSVSRTVRIDNSPPDAPQDLVVVGGEGWRASNDFDLRWKLAPHKSGARVAAAEYELCPAAGGKCIRGSQTRPEISSIDDLKVPEPGEYLLKLWLRDEAGNHDPRLAAGLVRLRYDDASPELAFEPLTAEDPTLLAVRTSDRGSGVTGGEIALRRRGQERWVGLPTSVDGSRLVARLDDERLGDGLYELRARAGDAAGNERSTDKRLDGRTAEMTLPLRLKTRLRAGMVRRKGRRARLARSAYVRYGQLVRVRGRLTTPEGNPMQGLEVRAFTQVRDGVTPPRLVATVRTTRTGRFSFLVRRGPSRTIRIRYGGTGQIRSATRIVVLNVRSRTSLRSSRRRLSNGETVRFRGRIRTGRIPPRGKLVELQVWVRGRYRTFATTRAGRRGTWRYDYRFDGTRGRHTYRFRAKLPPENGYPFASGMSRVVRVRVSGG